MYLLRKILTLDCWFPPLNGQKSPLFDTLVTQRESDTCETRKEKVLNRTSKGR